ncbi:MAG: DNA polymerase III subunit gamma and tau [Nakamurella sp.]
MALALYRKYRPATFSEVVGQEHVTEPLRTALAAGRINHAYLFSGPRGCGKTSSARILARSLNCEQGPTPDPCGVCGSCIALAPEGPGSLDVVELDAASHGGVDDTRDLRDKAFYMPAESRYRVFIIDEAHMVTPQGFNALLKIVEEPPEHLVFIFATTEPDKVLTTIRSRTHHYPFRLIPPTTLRALLERLCAEEGVLVEPAVLPLVIRAGGGSARDSLSILDQLLAGAGPAGVTYQSAVALLGVTDAALIDEVVDALAAADGASVFGAVDRVVEAGHDPRRFAADLLQRLRDLVIINAVPDAAARGLIDSPEDELASMVAEADRLGIATLTRMAEVLHTGLVDMRGTTSPRLVLELLCARMLLPGASSSDAALLQRLERMERRMEIAGPVDAADAMSGGRGPAGGRGALAEALPAGDQPRIVVRPTGPPPTSTGRIDEPVESAPAEPPRTAQPAPSRPGSRPAAEVAAEDRQVGGRRRGGAETAKSPDLGLPQRPTLSSAGRGRPDQHQPDQSPGGRNRAGEPEAERSTRQVPDHQSGRRQPDEHRPDQRQSEQHQSDQRQFDQHRPGSTGGDSARSQATGSQKPDQQHAGMGHRAPAGQTPNSARPEGSDPKDNAGQDATTVRDRVVPISPPTAAAAIEVTDVRRVWPEVLAAVQRQRRTTAILLDSATVVGVENGVLQLAMPSAGVARRVLEPNNADLLKAALKQVLGVDWAIRCEAAGPGSAGAGAKDTRGPVNGPTGGGSRGAPPPATTDTIPPPEEEDIPDDYGEPTDPDAPVAAVRDPEELAIALLSAELGARRLDPSA